MATRIRNKDRRTREQVDRSREAMIRRMQREARSATTMVELAQAIRPCLGRCRRRRNEPQYLAAETSLRIADYGFFGTTPMLWWKAFLWADDAGWIHRPPEKRMATR